GTTLMGGTLALAGDGRLADTGVLMLNGGTFDIGAVSDTVGIVTLMRGNILGAGGVLSGSSYSIANTADTVVVSAILGGAAAMEKSGAGALILSGANSYSGSSTIRGGVVSVGILADGGNNSGVGASSSAADNLILGDATLRYTGGTVAMNRNFTILDGTLSRVDVVQPATVLTLSGAAINSTGSLLKSGAGTLVFSGNNVYSGTTTIAGGVLQIGNGGTSGSPGAGAIINNGTLVLNRSDPNYVQSAAITGIGTVKKQGSGTNTLSGANTYSGSTIVESGTLRILGPVLPVTTTVRISDGGKLKLDYSGTNIIDFLFFNGESQARGTWGASGSGAQYTNSIYLNDRGILKVSSTFFRDGIMLLIR
ncbi:MAG: autotransporter-associated beta strand repeat-containing protein, partial [Verrucomicrobia bacterium]|nr:autotransporter-associated beta strand repeat-containing protein [Verrucomicrobiota bacterium]